MPFAFRQQDLADALGLSLVHSYKTLRLLRERGIARWMDGVLTIPKRSALAEFAGTAPEPLEKRPLM